MSRDDDALHEDDDERQEAKDWIPAFAGKTTTNKAGKTTTNKAGKMT